VPEKCPAQVFIAGDRVVSEGCRLVALLAHEAEAEVGGLNHVNVIGTIADSQCNLALREPLHEVDDLGLLEGRGAIDDHGLSAIQKFAELGMHEVSIESHGDDHARDEDLVGFDILYFNNKLLNLLKKLCCIRVVVLKHQNVGAALSMLDRLFVHVLFGHVDVLVCGNG